MFCSSSFEGPKHILDAQLPNIFVHGPFYIKKTYDSSGAWWSDLGRLKLTEQPMAINSLHKELSLKYFTRCLSSPSFEL